MLQNKGTTDSGCLGVTSDRFSRQNPFIGAEISKRGEAKPNEPHTPELRSKISDIHNCTLIYNTADNPWRIMIRCSRNKPPIVNLRLLLRDDPALFRSEAATRAYPILVEHKWA